MLCSRYGLPISTTHCLVGAVVGIGEWRSCGKLCEAVRSCVNVCGM